MLVLFLTVAVSGGATYVDYFHRWATSPSLGYSFETHLQLATQEAVDALADGQSGRAVLLSGSLFSQPQLRFALGQPVSMEPPPDRLLSSSEPRSQIRFIFDKNFDPRRPLVLLWQDGAQAKGAWTGPLVVPVDESTQQEEDSYVQSNSVVWPTHQLGWPAVFTGFLPDQAQFCSQAAPNPLLVDFTNGLRLEGYDLDVVDSPDGSTADGLRLVLYWQEQLATDGAYALPEERTKLHEVGVSVHLLSNDSIIEKQDGPIITDTIGDRSYVGGRVVEDVRTFGLPSTASLDDAFFQIKLFELDTGKPLADAESIIIPLEERGHTQLPDAQACLKLAAQWPFLSADRVRAQYLALSSSQQAGDRSSLSGVRYPADVRFANGMRLIAYDVWPDFIDLDSNDRRVRLSLFWQADAPSQTIPTGDEAAAWWNVETFDIFAHLSDGKAVWQTANQPFVDTQTLDRGGIVKSVHEFVIPQEMPAGKAYFETGLYHYAGPDTSTTSSDRLPIVNQTGQAADNMVTLGGVMIGEQTQQDRNPSLPLQATFQDYIELSDLQVQTSGGSQMDVILTWRALDRPGNDYTSFVHLINSEQAIVAQYDQPPGGVDNPTHLWAPNEMVRTSFPLQLPPGVDPDGLTLRIGLYDSNTGDRQPVLSLVNDEVTAPDGTYLLIPITVVP
jgi:hypothetical protein